LAVDAQAVLEASGIATAVVSMPCNELFSIQDKAYQDVVLHPNAARVVVEAGIRQSWDRLLGERGQFVGMAGFGASAPASALYKHFGITVEAIVAAAKTAIAGQ
jgi:transketolase